MNRFPRILPAIVLLCALMICFAPAPVSASDTAVASRITQAVDDTALTTIKGSTHPLAKAEFDRGPAAASLPLKRILMLLRRSPEQQTALSKFMVEQQEKSSPNFHKWLTPGQFGQTYGPSDRDIQTITAWLQLHGFTVSEVSKGRTVIEFSGTAGQVQEAFHTSIHKYLVNGEDHLANASDPRIPSALTPVVAGLVSLHNFPKQSHLSQMGAFSREKATGHLTPLFTFPFSGFTLYGLGPSDFATIYNVQPLWNAGLDGTGQTIAIVGQSNINIQDVRDFRTMWGLPANDPNIILSGPDPGLVPGDETESDLDVQWSGAVAKGATIDFVTAASTATTAGVDLSAFYIINNNLAPVMSESYGLCEAFLGSNGNLFYQFLWEQAAAQGITAMLSTGDDGAAGCDNPNSSAAQNGIAISGLASTPFNIAVGGTDFDQFSNPTNYWNATNTSTTQSSAKSYIPEIPWNNSCAADGVSGCPPSVDPTLLNATGGSGGPSTVYGKPTWQTGTGVPNDGVRDIPDVSLFASNGFNFSFYIICERDNPQETGTSCDLNSPFTDFLGIGGTSASSPAFAGIMGIVNQAHGPQGNANFVLYKLAAQSGASCNSSAFPPSSACTFYDTTKGNNSVPCVAGTPNCGTVSSGTGVLVEPSSTSTPAWTTTTGYDLATGLGSVNANNLVNNWTSASFTGSATTLTLSPTTVTHGQPVAATVTVAPTSGSGTPTGDISLLASGAANNAGIDAQSLINGGVSWNTTLLPGGAYTVTAHYPGDGAFGASDSTPPVSVIVSPENSSVMVRLEVVDALGNVSYPASVQSGSAYTLRLDALNSASSICAPPPLGGVACPTGSVTVTDNGAALATYKLNSFGYSDVAVQLSPVGTHTLAATYPGDNSYAAGTGSAMFTVSAASAFVLAGSPTSATVTAGQSATSTITVTSNSGFNSAVALTCSITTSATPAPTCSMNPTSVTPAANGTVTSTLTMNTTAASAASIVQQARQQSTPPFYAFWLPIAGLALLGSGLGSGRLRRKKLAALLLGLTVFAGLAFLVACGGGGGGGGGGGNPGTPAGSYTVVVTGTSGSLAPQTISLTLTVQ